MPHSRIPTPNPDSASKLESASKRSEGSYQSKIPSVKKPEEMTVEERIRRGKKMQITEDELMALDIDALEMMGTFTKKKVIQSKVNTGVKKKQMYDVQLIIDKSMMSSRSSILHKSPRKEINVEDMDGLQFNKELEVPEVIETDEVSEGFNLNPMSMVNQESQIEPEPTQVEVPILIPKFEKFFSSCEQIYSEINKE